MHAHTALQNNPFTWKPVSYPLIVLPSSFDLVVCRNLLQNLSCQKTPVCPSRMFSFNVNENPVQLALAGRGAFNKERELLNWISRLNFIWCWSNADLSKLLLVQCRFCCFFHTSPTHWFFISPFFLCSQRTWTSVRRYEGSVRTDAAPILREATFVPAMKAFNWVQTAQSAQVSPGFIQIGSEMFDFETLNFMRYCSCVLQENTIQNGLHVALIWNKLRWSWALQKKPNEMQWV